MSDCTNSQEEYSPWWLQGLSPFRMLSPRTYNQYVVHLRSWERRGVPASLDAAPYYHPGDSYWMLGMEQWQEFDSRQHLTWHAVHPFRSVPGSINPCLSKFYLSQSTNLSIAYSYIEYLGIFWMNTLGPMLVDNVRALLWGTQWSSPPPNLFHRRSGATNALIQCSFNAVAVGSQSAARYNSEWPSHFQYYTISNTRELPISRPPKILDCTIEKCQTILICPCQC